jgi:hypothetical protein
MKDPVIVTENNLIYFLLSGEVAEQHFEPSHVLEGIYQFHDRSGYLLKAVPVNTPQSFLGKLFMNKQCTYVLMPQDPPVCKRERLMKIMKEFFAEVEHIAVFPGCLENAKFEELVDFGFGNFGQ